MAGDESTKTALRHEECEEAKLETAKINRLFKVIFTLYILLNYDSGAVPAVLKTIQTELDMGPTTLGLLGGLQYIALCCMSPIVGKLLLSINIKKMMFNLRKMTPKGLCNLMYYTTTPITQYFR